MDFSFLDEDTPTDAAEVDAMRRGESSLPDVEAALILTDKVSSLMISVATGGPEIKKVDAEYKREHRDLLWSVCVAHDFLERSSVGIVDAVSERHDYAVVADRLSATPRSSTTLRRPSFAPWSLSLPLGALIFCAWTPPPSRPLSPRSSR